MRLLGTIHIGLYAIAVFEQENPDVDGTPVSGYFDSEAECIHIKAGMGHAYTCDILLHEIIHLAYFINKMTYEKKHDEETVASRVAPVLAEILVINNWVSAFIENRR